jgi:hypothetical protein
MEIPSAASRSSAKRTRQLVSLICFLALLCLPALLIGCKPSASHTSNPQLKQIDELINQQLPTGAPISQVNFFLNSRGYPVEQAEDVHSIVAVVEHVDTETLQPSAARVTFHFDANDKLVSYDLVSIAPTPAHP